MKICKGPGIDHLDGGLMVLYACFFHNGLEHGRKVNFQKAGWIQLFNYYVKEKHVELITILM